MEMWSGLGTVMATILLIRSIAKEYLPPEFHDHFTGFLRKLSKYFSSYITIIIDENEGMKVSEVYESVQLYLSVRSSSAASRLKLNKPKNAKEFTYTMDKNQQIVDEFDGVKAWWTFHSRELKQQMFSWNSISDEKRYFELKFHKKDKSKVFETYLPHVMAEAKKIELQNRHRKIYTNKGGENRSYEYRNRVWTPVVFDHPSTFETLALDPELKDDVQRDLTKFSQREMYYKKVGRAWKRGYLLYGPPGTGKSSMIAAISNHLHYDIYDLELTEVKSNTELRKLLIATTNKSIIVIEDIDCSLDLTDRKKKPKKESKEESDPATGKPENEPPESKVTLSGVLNFTDGLWSCCGSERIIIFTTNHVDRLDPALLRSGRMDKHIHLSFCTFPAFKVLAKNYLGVDDHPLFEQVEVLMKEAQITPADVSEELMRASDNPTGALENLIVSLGKAKEKADLALASSNGSGEANLVAEESVIPEEPHSNEGSSESLADEEKSPSI
ncbi:AAA-ATPase At3g50940 [Cryptomeria japonica]|uniref:AAA-ATPase At3g50940 n=1 Tax=Cryptomeria japonica TaxID=3369 RepID=UPI0025ABEE04|nr:AAA-ATPase At3g50940 [Cryptomeria japonica]